MRAFDLRDETQVAEARRGALKVAGEIGFRTDEAGRVGIVATELATNLLKHGGGGELLIGTFDDGQGSGVECVALDRGAGISNLAAAMRDGHSTAGSPGNGLGAVARLSHEMDVFSHGATGTAVLARLERGPPRNRPSAQLVCGAVSLPLPGEEACGDGWCVRREAEALTAMVVDGLGHGPLAASAAHAAMKVFNQTAPTPSIDLIERLHLALKPTRGAAASVMRLPMRGDVGFIGVGNVSGLLVSAGENRRMVSYNGTLGHALKAVRPFSYPANDETLVVLASDGLGTSWSLDAYPGLRLRHPTLIAAVLYRDFSRRRDDVTVLVARREAA